MAGWVRQKRDNFFIDLHWKGERLKLYSTKDGDPFYSERQANRILEKIRSEIDSGEFNPKNYSKRELKALRLEHYVTAWLQRQGTPASRRDFPWLFPGNAFRGAQLPDPSLGE